MRMVQWAVPLLVSIMVIEAQHRAIVMLLVTVLGMRLNVALSWDDILVVSGGMRHRERIALVPLDLW